MNKIVSAVNAFVADENGSTAIEYGLIATLVRVFIVAVVTGLGTQLKVVFNKVITALDGAAIG